MENIDIARMFDEIADVLELKGDNPFRIRSYRRGARVAHDLPEDAKTLLAAGTLQEVPGIGQSLAEKIEEIAKTGTCKSYEEIKRDPHYQLLGLLRIPGVGPKLAVRLHEELGVRTVDDLERAAKAGKLRSLDRMGEKLEEKILKGIEQDRRHGGRTKLAEALTYAESIVKTLRAIKGVTRIDMAGSLRRMKETIGDIDILVIAESSKRIMDGFTSMDTVSEILARGDTKSSVVLKSGIQVDLRILHKDSYGAALHYFTGSKDHNIVIRDRGKHRGLKISEYGVFDAKTEKLLSGRDEEDVFKSVGLPWIPPEIRENWGEIEAAEEGRLPDLVELEDIKGDLQMHTTATDGRNSIEEMAAFAKKLGYKYIAITDHSKAVRVAGGLNDKELAAHTKKIGQANRKIAGIEILAGIEVDILADGGLDLAEETLAGCDLVLAAIHSRFNMPKGEMTKRVIKGIQNKYVNIFAHPTGRLINEREPYEVDVDALIAEAKKAKIALELNAHPDRLDLRDIHCRAAKESGVKIAIDTDAHADLQLSAMRYGIATARRGWLEPADVINTWSLVNLKKFLSKGR
ncbi:MAG: DNA polymerase/3'-5' exonuclease PolX [Candidatus Eisenbacteria bacterium]